MTQLLEERSFACVVLGTGEPPYTDELRALADKWPERLAFIEAYDERLAHRIIAGSDLFVIPSRYEPCGLTQMYGSEDAAFSVFNPAGLASPLVDAIIEASFVADSQEATDVALMALDLAQGLDRLRDIPGITFRSQAGEVVGGIVSAVVEPAQEVIGLLTDVLEEVGGAVQDVSIFSQFVQLRLSWIKK